MSESEVGTGVRTEEAAIGGARGGVATELKRMIVVLPTYNERENLPIMVETLFSLGIPGLEILVVDDNSPDGTGDLAENLRELHPDTIHVAHRPEFAVVQVADGYAEDDVLGCWKSGRRRQFGGHGCAHGRVPLWEDRSIR